LTSDSDSSSETSCALCVTSSGKPTQRLLSWRGWKTRPWIKRLCGTISRPSTAARGVAAWTSSLRATRASRGALRVGSLASLMSATFGPTWRESLTSRGLPSFSWRTCQGLLLSLPRGKDPNSKRWATWLRQDYSAREKSAQASGGLGFSRWPTMRVVASRDVCRDRGKGNLGEVAAMWPAAKATQAGSLNRSSSGGPPQDLALTAKGWQTPSAADVLGGHKTRGGKRRGEALLKGQASRFFRPAPDTQTPGQESLKPARRLNPLFVEWLMGWPLSWTQIPSVCGKGE